MPKVTRWLYYDIKSNQIQTTDYLHLFYISLLNFNWFFISWWLLAHFNCCFKFQFWNAIFKRSKKVINKLVFCFIQTKCYSRIWYFPYMISGSCTNKDNIKSLLLFNTEKISTTIGLKKIIKDFLKALRGSSRKTSKQLLAKPSIQK